jgi:hypothetical protein
MRLQDFQTRREPRIMAADTDGDGRVSRAEFTAAATGGKGDPARRFTRLDRNGDGYVDRAEVDVMLGRRFRRLDADGDGMVTPLERATAKTTKGRTEGAARHQ